MGHKNLLKDIKDVKTVTSRNRVFSHAGAWPVSLEAGQMPAQARVFIWDRGRVAPGLVAAPASGAEPSIRQQPKQKAGGGILAR